VGYTVRVVCRPEVAAGFALAGLPTVEAGTPEEGAGRILALAAQPDVGVILVEDSFYDALSDDLQKDLGRRVLPMVVPFPGPVWGERAEGAEAHIVEILRQAIGYRVRLR
jgi:vacuolar-type H+-ATPase subunit F/Vma7